MNGKIGVGLVTYNRPEYYKKVLENIPKHLIDTLVIVNDGENSYVNTEDADVVILNKEQLGVGKSKNKILKYFIENTECEHLFLMEDDVLINDSNVFNVYIETANLFGIYHLNYEKVAGNEKTLKYSYSLPSGHSIGMYHNPQGAFSYFHKNIIKKFGYFDENYINAFEHIDLEYRLCKEKITLPFWYFPDVLNSNKYLSTIEGSDENSTITNKEFYTQNVEKSANVFIKKHGHFTNSIPQVNEKVLPMFLVHLETHYSRKFLFNEEKKLCIIIPYRDRKSAFDRIIPELTEYVSKQVKNFKLCVIEQNDNKPFNKGLLNNLGFLLNPDFDYYCFHDVDLIPQFSDYSYPEMPSHLSSHCSQFGYVNIPDKIMGGVITFRKEHFIKVNGYPCSYYGWGKEDDSLYFRCEQSNLIPYKHPFGRYYSVPHPHRLTNPIENELHLKNGERFEREKSGEISIFEDGLNTIKLDNFTVELNENDMYTHIKIHI